MNAFEEFQRKMKAEKDLARQKKTETAEMLRGYRGADAEEVLKLKALKEAERRQQLEAEQLLRGYRGGVSEEEMRLRMMKEEERRRQLEAERLLRSYQKNEEPDAKARLHKRDDESLYPAFERHEDDTLQNIQAGSVSARAAAFSSPEKNASPIKARPTVSRISFGGEDGLPSQTEIPLETEDQADGETEIVVEDNDPNKLPQSLLDEFAALPSTPEQEKEPPIADDFEEKKDEFSAPADPPEEEFSAPVDPPEEDHIRLPDPPSGEEEELFDKEADEVTEEDTDVVNLDYMESPRSVEAANETVEPPKPQDFRYDLYFSFGIVTDTDSPSYAAYMFAVSEVLQEVLQDNNNIKPFPSAHPKVISEQWDINFKDPIGRPNVRRVLIVAGVPLLLSNGVGITTAQQIVTNGLRAAMNDSDFLQKIRQEL